MNRFARIARSLWLLLFLACVAGCASTLPATTPIDAAAPHWQGRLLVKVTGPQPSSFSSSFELRGSATTGQLELSNVLGNVLARIVWAPGSASLHSSGAPQHFDGLDALTLKIVGAELPVAHLFDWLQGQPRAADGWQLDLSAQDQGRILAHRNTPLPEVDLRIVLDR